MDSRFEPIHLDKQEAYGLYFERCDMKASDYSFVNLWSWAEEYGICWAWTEHLVWIKQTRPETRLWAPVGGWRSVDWKRCFAELADPDAVFIRIPEELLRVWEEIFGDRVTPKAERGHWDYLYDIEELIELKGKRFHKKKNLLNQFRKKYDFQYSRLGDEMIAKAMSLQEDWCAWRDCESSDTLSSENRAIERVLANWNRLNGLLGGAIVVNGDMAAYTIAERLSAKTLVIHFEKGNPDYKGVYQAINQMFLEQSGRGYRFVNREQDLNDEGLRKAKLSYNPAGFLRKYNVRFN